MEIVIPFKPTGSKLKVVLFDFDGTLSTLRQGWESIMEPMMLEMVHGGTSPAPDDNLVSVVREYINQSTGIQTIYQMQWLARMVRVHRQDAGMPEDPWWYKEEYNRRLMVPVEKRIQSIMSGEADPKNYLMEGSKVILQLLKDRGLEIFVASGTDHEDVVREAEVLGLTGYFTEIAGAPAGKADCSKEAVIKKLISERKIAGDQMAVIGDGKVEIALGRDAGALTLGLASDEVKRSGINPVKRERLIKAGAHAIAGDFSQPDDIVAWFDRTGPTGLSARK